VRPFVFRAQAALDLRRRRDDEAKRELASANAAMADAQAALDASVADRERALRSARDAHAASSDVATIEWYRNWIVRQRREVTQREEVLTSRRDDAHAARDRATRTHMDVRVLEKLYERARRTYDAGVRREEQKAIDWLAVLRSYRAGEQEGHE
jgi:flagellar export protein FliJ